MKRKAHKKRRVVDVSQHFTHATSQIKRHIQILQELEKMVQPGRNALMYRIRDLDTGDSGEIENFVFVMVDKIPKYKEMGYQVVAD